MNKKIGGVILSVFLLSVLMTSFVFAQEVKGKVPEKPDSTFGAAVEGIVREYVNPITKFIIGDVTVAEGIDAGELLLIKFLFFIIILALVYYAVKRIPNIGHNKLLLFIIPLIISILSIRYISAKEIIEFIWLPTGVLGVAIATIIPFIIFFFFIEGVVNNNLVRKVGWVTFAVVYLMLAILRWDSLAVGSDPEKLFYNLGWFYLAIALLSLIVMMFDPKIRVMILKAKSASARQAVIDVEIARQNDLIDEYRRSMGDDTESQKYKNFEKRIEAKKKHIYKLEKEKASLS